MNCYMLPPVLVLSYYWHWYTIRSIDGSFEINITCSKATPGVWSHSYRSGTFPSFEAALKDVERILNERGDYLIKPEELERFKKLELLF